MVKVRIPKMCKKKNFGKTYFCTVPFFHDDFYLSAKNFQTKFTNCMINKLIKYLLSIVFRIQLYIFLKFLRLRNDHYPASRCLVTSARSLVSISPSVLSYFSKVFAVFFLNQNLR